MPSLVKPVPAKRTLAVRRLNKRQMALVKKIKKAGLKPVMYRRAKHAKGWSVHNPFLDAKRKAKEAFTPYKQRTHPQAWDSEAQRKFYKLHKTKKGVTAATRKLRAKGKKKKGFFDVFAP